MLTLVLVELVAVAVLGERLGEQLGPNNTTEGAQAALGGVGLLLVSAGAVVLVRGR